MSHRLFHYELFWTHWSATDVVESTGLQSLDTIVAIRAGVAELGTEYVTNGMEIAKVAEAYTAAINFAVENGLTEIQLEVNRLVPMMPSADD